MPEVKDKGNWMNQLHSKGANIIANIFGQRINYMMRYYRHRHRLPNFKNPQDLSERILSAMLSKDFLKYAPFADKVKVRDYVKQKGLERILLKQYGVWEDALNIDFDSLPSQFILKANNGCGGHWICTDKSLLDRVFVQKKMNETLKDARHLKNTEPHYCSIKPLILAEELMGDGTTLPVDYKFYCINGKVCFIFVACERETGVKFCTMDTEWNSLPYMYKEYLPKQIPPKPDHLREMVDVSETLSSDFEFVRVDLYEYQDKVFFGELTFSPLGGILSYFTTEAIQLLGKKFEEK